MFAPSALVALVLLFLSPAEAQDKTRNLQVVPPSVTIAAFGDWPYSQDLLDNSRKLTDSVNGDADVKLVVHVGDIHSGSMPCTGAGMSSNATLVSRSASLSSLPLPVVNPAWNIHVYNAFNMFNDPVVYTPGDNEWSDCHKTKQFRSGAPLAELAVVRELFFSKPGELMGKTRMLVTSQANSFTNLTDAQFVENVMWTNTFTTFATFNIPGGANDDDEIVGAWTAPFTNAVAQNKERTERAAANLRWLDATFDFATLKRSRAVVIFTQADMWDTEKTPSPGLSNFSPFVAKLAARSLTFKKPVLIVHGDSHTFKVDTPLVSNGGNGTFSVGCDTTNNTAVRCDLASIHGTPKVTNLMRIVVKGSGETGPLYWLKLKINPFNTTIQGAFTYENVCYDNCGPV